MPKASARHLLEKGLESLVLHLPDYIRRSLSCFFDPFFIGLATLVEINEKLSELDKRWMDLLQVEKLWFVSNRSLVTPNISSLHQRSLLHVLTAV